MSSIQEVNKRLEEEERKKNLNILLQEESQDEDFIPIEETNIKLSPISDAAKEIKLEPQQENNNLFSLESLRSEQKEENNNLVPLKDLTSSSNVMEGSVLDGDRPIDAEKIIEDNGYYSAENFYENLIKRTYGGAARDLIQNTAGFVNFLGDKFFDEQPLEFVKLDPVQEPTYFGGGLSRDLLGFAVPFLGVSKVASAINTVTKIPKATTFLGQSFRASLKGEVAVQFAFSPYEQRLSDLVQAFPTLANPITEYLQADNEDSEGKARLKMAIEGGIVGVAFDKLLSFVVRGKQAGVKTNIIKDDSVPAKELNKDRKIKNEKIKKDTGVTAQSFEDKVNLNIKKDPFDDISENIISQPVQKKIVKFFDELLKSNNLARNTNIRISQQMYDVLTSQSVMMQKGSKSIQSILKKNGLTQTDLADYFVSGARTSAQNLQQLSVLARNYGKFLGDGKITEDLAKSMKNSGLDSEILLATAGRRLDGVRRASMVGRWSTAMRNFISQQARVGMNVLYEGMQYGADKLWQKLSGKTLQRQVNPLTAMEGFLNTWRSANILNFKKNSVRARLKKDTENILKFYPKENDRLFLRYSSDVANKPMLESWSPISFMEKGANLLNFLNRFQEFITRRSVFFSSLDGIVRGRPDIYKGLKLKDLVADEKLLKTIRQEDIGTAIDQSLEMTYAKQPKKGSVGEKFVGFINAVPFTFSLIVPFPRFLVNSLKFLYDYSPAPTFVSGIRIAADLPIALLTASTEGAYTKALMRQLKEGDTTGMVKALAGWGLMGTAFQIRNSKIAGEKWNELKVGDKTIDVLPYNPLAAYLYVADLVNRQQNGTLTKQTFNVKEFAKVFAGTRGGTGLYLVDQMVNSVGGFGTNKGYRAMNEFVGKIAAQYLTPFKTYMGFLDASDGNIQAAKDTKTSTLENAKLDPRVSIVNNFKAIFNPGELQDLTSITHAVLDEKTGKYVARPLKNPNPILAELTGVTVRQDKNAAEKELDRLNFTYSEIFKSTGIPVLDRAYKNVFAPLVHNKLSELVQTDAYKSLPLSLQYYTIKESIKQFKKQTTKELQSDASLVPYLMEYQLNNIPKSQRAVINDIIGKDYLNNLILEFQKK
jgi:hypothetical protein